MKSRERKRELETERKMLMKVQEKSEIEGWEKLHLKRVNMP